MTILVLAIFGGLLGTLMMIPLRRSLIVKEHDTLPYPEGTACASVLKSRRKKVAKLQRLLLLALV